MRSTASSRGYGGLAPSGSGKTTLLLALAGLADVLDGSVRLDGEAPLALPARARDRWRGRSVGLLFQDLHLISGLSTLDNVLLAPFAAGLPQDRARALALLDELSLADRAHRPADTLSRGQAQRAATARAVLLRPKLILADEPTASLDDDACERPAEAASPSAASPAGRATRLRPPGARTRPGKAERPGATRCAPAWARARAINSSGSASAASGWGSGGEGLLGVII